MEQKVNGNNVVDVKGIKIGGNNPLVFIAGPCTIESKEKAEEITKAVKNSGANIFRGGSYKLRTSPYSFQGLGNAALDILKDLDMPTVSEITSIEQIPYFEKCVDIIQVGARNMHNYELLKALGKSNKPIILKRGFDSTIEEWLYAAEYIILGGNKNVILCERGIRTFTNETRFTLDLGAVTYVKKLSRLPVIVDPSHAAGKSSLVKPLALAAISAGADGLIIEVDTNPEKAISDGEQAITPEVLKEIIDESNKIKEIIK